MESKVSLKSLTVEGTKYRTLYTKKFENRKTWEEPDDRKIQAYIPGTILKVYVEPGQQVKAGEDLIILEAMKMKNHISIPFDATIKSINVIEGQSIAKDFCLLELE